MLPQLIGLVGRVIMSSYDAFLELPRIFEDNTSGTPFQMAPTRQQDLDCMLFRRWVIRLLLKQRSVIHGSVKGGRCNLVECCMLSWRCTAGIDSALRI